MPWKFKSKDILWWSVCLQREGYRSVEAQNPKQGFFLNTLIKEISNKTKEGAGDSLVYD